MNRSSLYGTALVLIHLVITIVHGQAHLKLQIGLGLVSKLFVVIVTLLAPLVAMGLLWTTHRRWGLVLLFLSMAGAFFFGLYNHLLVSGPDNVSQALTTVWGKAFTTTAYMLLVTEAIGAYLGLHSLAMESKSQGSYQ